jgi:hypothetical protein
MECERQTLDAELQRCRREQKRREKLTQLRNNEEARLCAWILRVQHGRNRRRAHFEPYLRTWRKAHGIIEDAAEEPSRCDRAPRHKRYLLANEHISEIARYL